MQMRHALIAADLTRFDLLFAQAEAQESRLIVKLLKPAARRGLPFMVEEIRRAAFLRAARRLGAPTRLTKQQLRWHPEIRTRFAGTSHCPGVPEQWYRVLYPRRGRNRRK